VTPAADRHLLADVAFEASASLTAGALQIDYRIANRSRSAVYVVDLFVRAGPNGPELRSDMATIGFAPPSTAIVARRCALPENTIFAMPPRFYATRIDPGARHRGTLHAALPLRLHRVRPSNDPARILTCTKLRIELPVVAERPELGAIGEAIGERTAYSLAAAACDRSATLAVEIDGLRLPFFVERP
jgi:hypothetical protein